MPAPVRIALKAAGFLLLASGLIYTGLFFTVRSDRFRAWAQTELSRRSGFAVELQRLRLSFPLRLIADGVKITGGRGFSFTGDRLAATLRPFDLAQNTVHRLILDGPRLRLDLQEFSPFEQEGAAPVAVRHLNVRRGAVVLASADRDIIEFPEIFLQGDNLDIGAQAGVHLRTDVPALKGVAELTVKGRPKELEATAVVRGKATDPPSGNEAAKPSIPALLRLDAQIRLTEAQSAEAVVDGKFHDLVIAAHKFTGTIAARLRADPGLRDITFTGHGNLADFPAAYAAANKLPRGTAQANFAGTYSLPGRKLTLGTAGLASPLGSVSGSGEVSFDSQPVISQARVTWQQIPLETLKTLLPAPFDTWSYQGHGQVDGEIRGPWSALEFRGVARSENLRLQGDGWKTANLNILLPIAWTPADVRVDEGELKLAGVEYRSRDRWQAAIPSAQATASLTLDPKEPLRIRGRFATEGGRFASPSNDRLGENLSLAGSFDWTSAPQTDSWNLKLGAHLNAGEVLWGTIFADLGARKPTLAMDASYFPAADRLECRKCALSIAQVGTVSASGVIDRVADAPVMRLQLSSDDFLPGGFFDHFVRENFHRRFPFLDRLRVAGNLAFASEVHGTPADLRAAGQLSIQGGELRSELWRVGPLSLHLPFDIRSPASGDGFVKAPRLGVLAIEQARFGNQSLEPLKAAVSFERNTLRFHQDVRLGLFGGDIIVRDLLWPDLVSDPKRLSFSLQVKELNLEELTEELDWPRFSGTLTGSIPEVQATSNALRTKGTIQADLFGGRMTVSQLEIENPFSSLAGVRLDAAFTDIRLEQLSKTFAFGHVSGILAGSIEDLVIVDGQPAEFRADFQSVSGGEQRISVEALNKITVLSSGQNASALYGGLAGFFDSFRYSKLGFKAQLKNDRLTLRGVETRGDQEYLVVGSFLPPTVNVVSHTQVIAFSELLRRLESIASGKAEIK